MIFNFGYSQCNDVRDLPDSIQNKILTKLIQLKACEGSRVIDSTRISHLKIDLKQSQGKVSDLTRKVRKSKNITIIGTVGGVVLGWIARKSLVK